MGGLCGISGRRRGGICRVPSLVHSLNYRSNERVKRLDQTRIRVAVVKLDLVLRLHTRATKIDVPTTRG